MAFPSSIVPENARRTRLDPEYELEDTGIFGENRYFDVFGEYAKYGVFGAAVCPQSFRTLLRLRVWA